MEEENDLFSLCIKDGTLKIGDSTKNRYVHNHTEQFRFSAWSCYVIRLVNYTVWQFRSLIMKIFKTECLLNAQLPNTHACSSATQAFCPNPLLWVVTSEKTCNKLIFDCFARIWPYFSPTKYYRKQQTTFYDEIAF